MNNQIPLNVSQSALRCIPSPTLTVEESQHWKNLSLACHIQVDISMICPLLVHCNKVLALSEDLILWIKYKCSITMQALKKKSGQKLILDDRSCSCGSFQIRQDMFFAYFQIRYKYFIPLLIALHIPLQGSIQC